MVFKGLTSILCVVSPVLHTYESAPEAVRVVVSPSVILTSIPASMPGKAFTVTTTSSILEQLFSITSTEYVVVVFGLTVILCEVAPVFQT